MPLIFLRRLLLSGLLALPLAPLQAQHRPAPKPAPKKVAAPAAPVYDAYQLPIQPEYAEGKFALQQYLTKQLRLPEEVKTGGVRGTVQVTVTVQPDGHLTDAFIVRGLSAATNAEALRLVQAMPRWRPGRRDEQPVAARVPLVVVFAAPEPAGGRVVEEIVENKVYTYVEQMPQFPGGREAMLTYFSANLRYPAEAVNKQIEGRVFVSFVVQPTGRASDAKIIKGLGGGCDEEVLRLVQAMPAWEPGKQNGHTVAVSYTVPVTFSLANANTKPGGVAAAPAPVVEEKIYTYVEQMPALGTPEAPVSVSTALQAALVLPAEVREGRSEGQAYVSFVVRPDGSVTDAKILRSLCASCDEAALAAVRALPRFAPGKQNGVAVAVQLSVPVTLYGPNHVFEAQQVASAASFPGGDAALRHYLTDKLREPKVLKQENLSGAVAVRFVVQADGRVGSAEIVRPLCSSCDAEALRLVRDMPHWTPARNAAGQPVAVRQNLFVQMPKPAAVPRGSTGQAPARRPATGPQAAGTI